MLDQLRPRGSNAGVDGALGGRGPNLDRVGFSHPDAFHPNFVDLLLKAVGNLSANEQEQILSADYVKNKCPNSLI